MILAVVGATAAAALLAGTRDQGGAVPTGLGGTTGQVAMGVGVVGIAADRLPDAPDLRLGVPAGEGDAPQLTAVYDATWRRAVLAGLLGLVALATLGLAADLGSRHRAAEPARGSP